MKLNPFKRRGLLVGVVAAVVAFLASLIALTLVYWFLRPFVWAAIYQVPYSPPSGPYPPDSGEWLFVHAAYFISAVFAGFVGAKWAGSSDRWLTWGLAVVWFLLAASGVPETSHLRQGIYLLGIPLGILCGGVLLRRRRVTPAEAVA